MSLFSAMGWASSRAGTGGAAFLKIGPGARPDALGQAYSAVADDALGVFYNPAGLGRLSRPELAATYTQWILSGQLNALAAAVPTRWGTWSAHAVTLSYEGLEKRTSDSGPPDGTFNSLDAAYGLSYGASLNPRWRVGASALYVRRTVDGISASAPAGSLGTQYDFSVADLTLGAAVRNIGGDIQFIDQGDPLPLTAAVGVSARPFHRRLLCSLEARQCRSESLAWGGGVEASPSIYKEAVAHLRAGWRSDSPDVDKVSGLSLGLGVGFPRWAFDASWSPAGALGDTLRYSFRFMF